MSDKIDKVVTNRFAALPIFAVVMFIVYYVSVSTVGTIATDWANDGVFGDGWHLFGIGSSEYEGAAEEYTEPGAVKEAFEAAAQEKGIEPSAATELTATASLYDDDGNVIGAVVAFAMVGFILFMLLSPIRKQRLRNPFPLSCSSRKAKR